MVQIYTRRGDRGKTGLADGLRLSKASALIAAIGDVDECNAHLGLLISQIEPTLANRLQAVQHQLFAVGATLAGAKPCTVSERHVLALEQHIDQLEATLPPLTQFILPGGNPGAAQAHITRTVCRRAERNVVKAGESTPLPEIVVAFLNRLADLLFVVARVLAAANGGDVPWRAED